MIPSYPVLFYEFSRCVGQHKGLQLLFYYCSLIFFLPLPADGDHWITLTGGGGVSNSPPPSRPDPRVPQMVTGSQTGNLAAESPQATDALRVDWQFFFFIAGKPASHRRTLSALPDV